MHFRTLFLSIAGVASVALLWLIVATHREVSHTSARIVLAREGLTRVGLALRQAQKTVVRLPRREEVDPAAAAPERDVKIANPAPDVANPPGFMKLARANPQLFNLFVASERSRLRQRYGLLLQQLRLTNAQCERFKDIHIADMERDLDIAAAANEQGLTAGDPVIQKLRADSHKLMDDALTALLGPDGASDARNFERLLPVCSFIDRLAADVASTVPLKAQQAEQLAQALAAASPSYQTGNDADPETVDWDAVDLAARAILFPTQITAWTNGESRAYLKLLKVYRAEKAKPSNGG